MRLGSVLGAEADQDHATLADLEVDDRRATLQEVGSLDVPADEDVGLVLGVAGDDSALETRVGKRRRKAGAEAK